MSVSSTQIFGPIEVGAVLETLLNGALTLQINRYLRKRKEDPLFLRLLICSYATVSHLFLSISTLYILTITNYGTPILETLLPWPLFADAGLGTFVHASVQSIYTWRLYKLRGHWMFPTICWALSAFVLGSGITYPIVEPRGLTATVKWNWIFYSHFSVAAGVDILIAASTCWNLIQGRDNCLKRTQQLVDRIMLRIVQTGVATRSAVAVSVLITFTACQPTTAWLGLYMPLTPLYPVTLLALLNGRVKIKDPLQGWDVELSAGSRIQFDAQTGAKSTVHA
ncbi:hypothetical protein BD779DRAFT_1673331 [Infundibulicybe gibba]|nr:hypothetical protein BD779DRAFT_1673331 [Infundibulicybe gibba]